MVEIAIEGNVKMIETKCPDCGSINFFNNRERDEVICRDCSFVVAEGQVDFGSETRAFEFEDVASKSRSGAPFDPRVANNLTTQIGTYSDLDKLSKKQRVLMHQNQDIINLQVLIDLLYGWALKKFWCYPLQWVCCIS